MILPFAKKPLPSDELMISGSSARNISMHAMRLSSPQTRHPYLKGEVAEHGQLV